MDRVRLFNTTRTGSNIAKSTVSDRFGISGMRAGWLTLSASTELGATISRRNTPGSSPPPRATARPAVDSRHARALRRNPLSVRVIEENIELPSGYFV